MVGGLFLRAPVDAVLALTLLPTCFLMVGGPAWHRRPNLPPTAQVELSDGRGVRSPFERGFYPQPGFLAGTACKSLAWLLAEVRWHLALDDLELEEPLVLIHPCRRFPLGAIMVVPAGDLAPRRHHPGQRCRR